MEPRHSEKKKRKCATSIVERVVRGILALRQQVIVDAQSPPGQAPRSLLVMDKESINRPTHKFTRKQGSTHHYPNQAPPVRSLDNNAGANVALSTRPPSFYYDNLTATAALLCTFASNMGESSLFPESLVYFLTATTSRHSSTLSMDASWSPRKSFINLCMVITLCLTSTTTTSNYFV